MFVPGPKKIVKAPPPARLRWSVENGWVVDTTISLRRHELAALVAHAKKVQGERIRAAAPGDRREQMISALAALTPEAIRQNVVPEKPWLKDRLIYTDRS